MTAGQGTGTDVRMIYGIGTDAVEVARIEASVARHGSRFVERILTVHATLRLQDRPILPFLRAACEARLRRSAPPSLLPSRCAPLRATA